MHWHEGTLTKNNGEKSVRPQYYDSGLDRTDNSHTCKPVLSKARGRGPSATESCMGNWNWRLHERHRIIQDERGDENILVLVCGTASGRWLCSRPHWLTAPRPPRRARRRVPYLLIIVNRACIPVHFDEPLVRGPGSSPTGRASIQVVLLRSNRRC
jgi:hypothetical protein